MCKNNTHITAIFNFVFCKTKYKSYVKCKYHLNDTSVDDMPKSKQESAAVALGLIGDIRAVDSLVNILETQILPLAR